MPRGAALEFYAVESHALESGPNKIAHISVHDTRQKDSIEIKITPSVFNIFA